MFDLLRYCTLILGNSRVRLGLHHRFCLLSFKKIGQKCLFLGINTIFLVLTLVVKAWIVLSASFGMARSSSSGRMRLRLRINSPHQWSSAWARAVLWRIGWRINIWHFWKVLLRVQVVYRWFKNRRKISSKFRIIWGTWKYQRSTDNRAPKPWFASGLCGHGLGFTISETAPISRGMSLTSLSFRRTVTGMWEVCPFVPFPVPVSHWRGIPGP